MRLIFHLRPHNMVRKKLDTPKYVLKDKSLPLRLIKISNAQAEITKDHSTIGPAPIGIEPIMT